jgi:NADPH:quinone reductase-like Zn-dependent oxidoreductase
MRAASFDHHGGPEVLAIRDWADPEPGPGQVRVRVAGCGVNHLDIFVRQGIPGVGPFPHIPGSEVSGTIDRLGAGVEPGRIEVGTAVVVAPGRGCGRCRDCRRGRDNLCADFRVLGNQRQGGFAEFVVVSADDCIPVGDRIPLADWAAVPLVFQTAWNMLHALGSVRSGDEVLVESAGSGVGTAAIQVAMLAGARVIATAGGAEKCERLRSMGVKRVIDHT